jgi:hypothetical protein
MIISVAALQGRGRPVIFHKSEDIVLKISHPLQQIAGL